LHESSVCSDSELRSRVCGSVNMMNEADSNTSCFNLLTHIRFA